MDGYALKLGQCLKWLVMRLGPDVDPFGQRICHEIVVNVDTRNELARPRVNRDAAGLDLLRHSEDRNVVDLDVMEITLVGDQLHALPSPVDGDAAALVVGAVLGSTSALGTAAGHPQERAARDDDAALAELLAGDFHGTVSVSDHDRFGGRAPQVEQPQVAARSGGQAENGPGPDVAVRLLGPVDSVDVGRNRHRAAASGEHRDRG
jgi:hypothetical protein